MWRSLLGVPRPWSVTTLAVVAVPAAIATGISVSMGFVVGLCVVGATALALAVLRHPALGGYLVVAGVPLLSGMRRGFPVPGLRLSEALVAFAAVLVLVPACRREVPRWTWVDRLALAYAAGSLIFPVYHLLARGQSVTMSSMASMLLALQFFLLFRTVRVALPDPEQRRMAVRVVLGGSLVVAAIAAAQQLNIGPARQLVLRLTESDALGSSSYAAYARATGPFQHWHPLAGYLTVVILLTVALLLDSRQRIVSRREAMVVLAASVAALMLSVTFIAMIGVVLGVALLGARAGHFRMVVKWSAIVGVVALVVFGPFVVQRLHNQYIDGASGARQSSWVPQTIGTRLTVWRDQYLPGMEGRWATGYGPDLPVDVSWTHTESLYMTLLLRGGLPLLAVFVALLWVLSSSVSRGSRLAGTADDRRPLAEAIVAIVAVSWLMNLLYPYFTSSGMPQPFWVVAALALATGGTRLGVRGKAERSMVRTSSNRERLTFDR